MGSKHAHEAAPLDLYDRWRENAHKSVPAEEVEAYVKAAQRLHDEEGEVEVDDNAVVSFGGDDGAYVLAWVWVPDDQVKRPEKG